MITKKKHWHKISFLFECWKFHRLNYLKNSRQKGIVCFFAIFNLRQLNKQSTDFYFYSSFAWHKICCLFKHGGLTIIPSPGLCFLLLLHQFAELVPHFSNDKLCILIIKLWIFSCTKSSNLLFNFETLIWSTRCKTAECLWAVLLIKKHDMSKYEY